MSGPLHPAWRWREDDVRALGEQVAGIVAAHLAGLPSDPVFRPVPPAAAAAFATAPLPLDGTAVDEVLARFVADVLPYPFGNGHPRFYAWVNSPPHALGVFAEALAAAMNPSVAGGNHAAVHVERQVVRWFADLAGFPSGATGLLVSGGSMATLTAFTVARHRATRAAGIDVRADGLQGLGRRCTLYVGSEGHGSAHKAAELLGIGSANVRVVPSDAAHRMRPDLLRSALDQDVTLGCLPLAVMATAGTVNTGAIDPLDEIADVCAEHGIWLHVDGSYGGPAVLLLDRYAEARAALARADSIAMDPHKWLYAPVDAGLVLLRDAAAARDAFSLVPAYLRTDGDPSGVGGPVWFSEFGFDQTRPFRALKVWMLLRHLGVTGYRDLIAHDIAVADRLADGITAAPQLRLLARGLSVVCFRAAPAGCPADALDDLNRRVLTDVQLGGRAFLAGTTVDGVFALRACVVNPGSGGADADAVVAEVLAALSRQG
ncbi:aminotransferase class V-fold PLP-dependent enzyme [Dactylosporangium sp. NPDC049525]|uniref:pyridoxal phosphate-dependent decarboxylase family protein n=1 Tax=Dactylosporangium sp. NPDC049525 TaxID=3154730 RepID=UPI00341681FE